MKLAPLKLLRAVAWRGEGGGPDPAPAPAGSQRGSQGGRTFLWLRERAGQGRVEKGREGQGRAGQGEDPPTGLATRVANVTAAQFPRLAS